MGCEGLKAAQHHTVSHTFCKAVCGATVDDVIDLEVLPPFDKIRLWQSLQMTWLCSSSEVLNSEYLQITETCSSPTPS